MEGELQGAVRLIETFEERNEILMILELMHGDLTSPEIKVSDLPKILVDILVGLRDLHFKAYIHFDIRPGGND